MLNLLPLLTLENLVHYLPLIDILSLRFVDRNLHSLCESTHFYHLSYFNAIVLFRRLFERQASDHSDNFVIIKSLYPSKILGKFSILISKESTQLLIKYENSYFDLGTSHYFIHDILLNCNSFEIKSEVVFKNKLMVYFSREQKPFKIDEIAMLLKPSTRKVIFRVLNQNHPNVQKFKILMKKLPTQNLRSPLLFAFAREQTLFALDFRFEKIVASQFNFVGQKANEWSLKQTDFYYIRTSFHPLTKYCPILLQSQNLKQVFFFVPHSHSAPSIILITSVQTGYFVDMIETYFESDLIFFQLIRVVSSTELHRTIFSYDYKSKRLFQLFSDLIDEVPIMFDPFTISAKNALILSYPKLILKHSEIRIELKNFE